MKMDWIVVFLGWKWNMLCFACIHPPSNQPTNLASPPASPSSTQVGLEGSLVRDGNMVEVLLPELSSHDLHVGAQLRVMGRRVTLKKLKGGGGVLKKGEWGVPRHTPLHCHCPSPAIITNPADLTAERVSELRSFLIPKQTNPDPDLHPHP